MYIVATIAPNEGFTSSMTRDISIGIKVWIPKTQIENGNPTLDKLKEIASILGISLAEFVADEETGTTIKCPHCGEIIELDIKTK